MKRIEVQCEWGHNGIKALYPTADVIIIVDVLSFSTCVDIAANNRAIVYPYQYKDSTAAIFAHQKNAILAKKRSEEGYTLSPASLLNIKPKTNLVLPSPNGSTLTLETKPKYTLAGCLRNATVTAMAAAKLGQRIAVIPAGERWPDNSIRFAYEDLIGAGAIINALDGFKTMEAKKAEFMYLNSRSNNFNDIFESKSGRELTDHGFKCDVDIACQHDVSRVAAIFCDEYYKAYEL